MKNILLINPNASDATTAMMVRIAAHEASTSFRVSGVTAGTGVGMIVNESELSAAAFDVECAWRRTAGDFAGVIVSAFGDPGIERLREMCKVPVVGICEASMLEASEGWRKFGIATVTPDLVVPINARADELGLRSIYTGLRVTAGDPRILASDPQALQAAIGEVVQRCIDEDGAQAVIIGGGPLGQAAVGLGQRFSVPVISPIPSAVRLLHRRMQAPGA